MATVNISLQRRLQQRTFLLLGAVFIVITLAIMYFVDSLNVNSAHKSLQLKHQIIEQVFNGYLNRAEDEMSLITQDLSLSHFEPGRELDLLFRHHEVLLFGGLDFFYIEWLDKPHAMDPRARLFTEVDFLTLLDKGLVSRWVVITTNDDSTLLMYKKKIVSNLDDNEGYLYGFISLNDNLTLANELLDNAKVSEVRIYDNDQNTLLLKEHKLGVDASGATLRSVMPLRAVVQANLRLEIIETTELSFTRFKQTLPFLVAIGFVLFSFYFLLINLVKRSVFTPLANIDYKSNASMAYQELEPIQRKSQQDQAFIKAKEQRFNLLMESTHCAIIFCSEVTEVEVMNAEAKEVFPDAAQARTIFDFMPISCHQSIQQALKGEVGVSFDLTIDNLRRLYKWQAHSFINESTYQGVLLVGRDITKESSLVWQLDQLQPLSASVDKTVDACSMYNEFVYLSNLPMATKKGQIQSWVKLFISVLDNLKDDAQEVSYLSIGELLSEESALIMREMEIESDRAFINCSLEVGAAIIAVDLNVRSLVRVLLMMVLSNDMEERCLGVRLVEDKLTLIAMHDMTTRALFSWMIKALIDNLSGKQTILQNNALQLELLIELSEQQSDASLLCSNQVVVWVANDYPSASMVEDSLKRLGVQVECYISSASFFTRASNEERFDAVLIGCDRDISVQAEMTETLKFKYKRKDLPIVWLNSFYPRAVDPDVLVLSGCPFDYSIYQALLLASKRNAFVSSPLNEEASWLVVGGSRVTKAIWHSALCDYSFSVQWIDELNYSYSTLSHESELTIILLEPQPSELLRAIQLESPIIRFFSVRNWLEMPDNVALFEMDLPYSVEKIKTFAKNVMIEHT